ncbi:MAG TPA: hypothetical protein VFI95_16055 [Terriglobales bacterium]|nr:hypothetical protein [Terriglobales bacterium]
MTRVSLAVLSLVAVLCSPVTPAIAQQNGGTSANAAAAAGTVPRLVRFSGVLSDATGKQMSGVVGVTFLLYRDEHGGAPLWIETQNVSAGNGGHYSVMLGSTTGTGLPANVFASGEARWLAVQAQGQPEQRRALLVAVPYALKAGDADTVGGLPPSAFVLAAAPGNSASNASDNTTVPQLATTVTGSGTTGFLSQFTSSTNVGNSAVFQSGVSPTAKIGINTNAPAAALDVNGATTVRGTLQSAATAAATSSAGKNSQPHNFVASAFNSGSAKAVPQTFQLRAEPIGNNSATASATLNLLFGQGTNTPAETGLRISSKGIIGFATGQTFPGTGTVSSVATGLGLTGGTITKTGTISIDTTVVPQLKVSNFFVGQQNIIGDLSVNGLIGSQTGVSTNGQIVGPSAQLAGANNGVPTLQVSNTGTTGMGLTVSSSNDTGLLVSTGGSLAGVFSVSSSSSIPLTTETNGAVGCTIDGSGNLLCTGSKSAVVPVANGTRKVALYAIEGPENWFEDAGSGKLTNGAAIVHLEPIFAETINTMMEYHVFLTPNGDCKGLYVTNKGPAGFEVHELGGGASNIGFDYRIMAKRKGFENIRLADRTKEFAARTVRPALPKLARRQLTASKH